MIPFLGQEYNLISPGKYLIDLSCSKGDMNGLLPTPSLNWLIQS